MRQSARVTLLSPLLLLGVLFVAQPGCVLVEAARLYCEPPGRYWVTSRCYDLLGVGRRATRKDVKKAYRHASLNVHPDKVHDTSSAGAFIELTNAYDILSDPHRRAEYDEALAHPGDQVWNYVTQQLSEFVRKNPWAEKPLVYLFKYGLFFLLVALPLLLGLRAFISRSVHLKNEQGVSLLKKFVRWVYMLFKFLVGPAVLLALHVLDLDLTYPPILFGVRAIYVGSGLFAMLVWGVIYILVSRLPKRGRVFAVFRRRVRERWQEVAFDMSVDAAEIEKAAREAAAKHRQDRPNSTENNEEEEVEKEEGTETRDASVSRVEEKERAEGSELPHTQMPEENATVIAALEAYGVLIEKCTVVSTKKHDMYFIKTVAKTTAKRLFMTWTLHSFFSGYSAPLIIQSVFVILNLFEHPLFSLYILRLDPLRHPHLQRPFGAQKLSLKKLVEDYKKKEEGEVAQMDGPHVPGAAGLDEDNSKKDN